MSLIFDAKSARLYALWFGSPQGQSMERVVEAAFPELLRPQPGERILDIGCGEGNHLLFFSRLGLNLSGLDASPYMIRRAGARLGKRSNLKVGRAEDLPYEDNEFDFAALINTLEFVDDPVEAMREAGRVARKGVFIGVLNSISWNCLCSKLEGLFRQSLLKDVSFFNLWQLKSYARNAFGNVPVSWRCAPVRNAFLERVCGVLSGPWYLEHCPFGSFLAFYASMRYWVKTDQHRLKVSLKKARRSVVSGVSRERIHHVEVVSQNERSLSL
jgi:SAM-dependent methyltransferase